MEENIKGWEKFDLRSGKNAIEILSHLTQDEFKLINLTLFNSPDNKLLGDFQQDFMQEQRDKYKYIICYHYSNDLKYTFINSMDQFIFNDYFLNNSSSTDLEKKSRLNLLLTNMNNLLNKILADTKQLSFEKPDVSLLNNLENEFKNKFESKYIITNDHNLTPLKISRYPFNLLLFCLGINLNEIYNKLLIEYSGYLHSSLSHNMYSKNEFVQVQELTKNVSDTGKKTLSRNEILKILFKGDNILQEKFFKVEDKIIAHNYLNNDKSKWLKKPADFIRFYNYCEKHLLRKGVYEENSKGVLFFRDLYDFHEGNSIDSPSKRAIQKTKNTKNDFDFLDF